MVGFFFWNKDNRKKYPLLMLHLFNLGTPTASGPWDNIKNISKTKWINITIYLKFRQFFKTLFLRRVSNYLQDIYRLQCELLWLIFLNKNTSIYIYIMNLISLQSIHFGQLYINSSEENSKRGISKMLWLMDYVYIFPKGLLQRK